MRRICSGNAAREKILCRRRALSITRTRSLATALSSGTCRLFLHPPKAITGRYFAVHECGARQGGSQGVLFLICQDARNPEHHGVPPRPSRSTTSLGSPQRRMTAEPDLKPGCNVVPQSAARLSQTVKHAPSNGLPRAILLN